MKSSAHIYKKTGALFEDHSSSDSSEERGPGYRRRFDISDLYDQIGAPNKIQDKNIVAVAEVKTAYDLKFQKLPVSMNNYRHEARRIVANRTSDIKVEEKSPAPKREKSKDFTMPRSSDILNTSGKTLFTIYPEGDSRLVYKKYVDQGDWQLDRQSFANYLVDLNKINKNIKTQYATSDDISYRPPSSEDGGENLRFNSVFESGNLYSAYKLSNNEYDLILQNDINTRGHTQWFFFSVENAKKDDIIKFNIINLLKPDSLFNEGMQPVIFSKVSNSNEQKGWYRDGFNISYFRNNIPREGVPFSKSYYTLTFTYKFPHNKDTVYFAHCFPYTYSRLTDFIDSLCQDPLKKQYLTRKTLCQTLSQNNCEYLTIANGKTFSSQEKDDRLGIILTARQHPGESLASYIMQGALEFLTSEEKEAKALRELCVFKVIPMLNPDGVIHGNYRASLCGKDLNRKWKSANRMLQPTVFYTKELIHELSKTRNVELFCDFHGHSRKKNAFFYGNSLENNPLPARVFPFMLSKLSKYVSFADSRFVIEKSKEETARVALWRELKVDNVFTLEASFHGYADEGKIHHFTEEDYINIGRDFCKGLCQYLSNMSRSKIDLGIEPNPEVNAQEAMKELLENQHLVDLGNQEDDSGSDNAVSEDELSSKEMKKMLPGKAKVSVKKQPKKNRDVLEKARILSQTTKKSERFTTEGKESFISDKSRPPSDKSPKFRIGHLRKSQSPQMRDLTTFQTLAKINQVVMVDKATQTDDYLFASYEEIRVSIDYQPFSQYRDQKSNLPKSVQKNVNFFKNMETVRGGASYMTVFNNRSVAVSSSPVRINHNIVNSNGATKVKTDSEFTPEPYQLAKYHSQQMSFTSIKMQSPKKVEPSLFSQLWTRTNSSTTYDEQSKEKTMGNHQKILTGGRKHSVQFPTQEDNFVQSQNFMQYPILSNFQSKTSASSFALPNDFNSPKKSENQMKSGKLERPSSRIYEMQSKSRTASERFKEKNSTQDKEESLEKFSEYIEKHYIKSASPNSRMSQSNRIVKDEPPFLAIFSVQPSAKGSKDANITESGDGNGHYRASSRTFSLPSKNGSRPGTSLNEKSFTKTMKVSKGMSQASRRALDRALSSPMNADNK